MKFRCNPWIAIIVANAINVKGIKCKASGNYSLRCEAQATSPVNISLLTNSNPNIQLQDHNCTVRIYLLGTNSSFILFSDPLVCFWIKCVANKIEKLTKFTQAQEHNILFITWCCLNGIRIRIDIRLLRGCIQWYLLLQLSLIMSPLFA